jgi:hypothetical protein
LDRDFITRIDYDAFKALTAQTITLIASKGTNNSITIVMPVAIKDTYAVNLSGQGDVIRASIAYQGIIDSTGKSYSIACASQLDLTTFIG